MLGGFFGSSTSDEETAYVEQSSTRNQSLLDRTRSALGMQPTLREEVADACCPKLTYEQRLIGFCCCFCAGGLISLLSMAYFKKLVNGNPVPFAVLYTIGNIVALSSTMFLVGCAKQFKRMYHPTRAACACVFVSAMIATLVSAIVLPRYTDMPEKGIGLIVICCIVIQFCAFFWYSLSYIPYGRRMCKACCVSAMSDT